MVVTPLACPRRAMTTPPRLCQAVVREWRWTGVEYRVSYGVSQRTLSPNGGGHERAARFVGSAERGPQVRAPAAPGVRGRHRRGVAAERRAGVHDPATARAGRPRRVG